MKTKFIIIILLVVAIAVVIIFGTKQPSKSQSQPSDDSNFQPPKSPVKSPIPVKSPTPVKSPAIAPTKPVDSPFPLKNGSKGDKAKQLQVMLNHNNSYYKLGGQQLSTDGNIGAKTISALKAQFGITEVIESQYHEWYSLFNAGVAIGRNYIGDKWPYERKFFNAAPSYLRIGDHGDKVENLNKALFTNGAYNPLGAYNFGKYPSREFTADTVQQLKRKGYGSSVTQSQYLTILRSVGLYDNQI
jgi:hypothetical protein